MAHLFPTSIDMPKDSGTRSREKCNRCRRDHQKCLPENRRWNEEQEPCQRCKERDYDCGPSETLTRKRQRMSQPSFSSDSDEPDTHPTVGIASAIDKIPSARDDAYLPAPSQSTKRRTRTRPLKKGATFGHIGDNAPALSSKTGQNLPPTGRKQCEMSCRKLLKELGDIKALRKNIILDLDKLNEWDRLLGPCDVLTNLRALYKAWISAVDKMTTKLIDEGTTLLLSDKGGYTECFLRRLEKFTNDLLARDQIRHVDWVELDQSTVSEAVRLQQVIHDAVYRSQKKKEVYSEAEFICDALDGHPKFLRRPSLGSEPETDAAYRRAAGDIQQMCSKLAIIESDPQVLSDPGPSFVSIQRGYPAPQLAYRVCDSWSAFRLWSDPTSENALDMLQRSLLHYAVDAGDVTLVQNIAKINSEIIKHAGTDTFGMSLLAIAAVRNNNVMFDLLFESGAVCCASDTDTGVLALAAYFGNTAIVRQMLACRPHLPNLGRALHRAIDGRHKEPARLILGCMLDQACYDEKELEGAAQKADWQSLDDLAAEIRTVAPLFATPLQALKDVESANFEDSRHDSSSRSFLPVMPTNQWHGQTLLAEEVPPHLAGVFTPYPPLQGSTRINVIHSTQLHQQQSFSSDPFHEDSGFFQ